MAEVRQRCGSGVHHFAHRIYNRCLPETHSKQSKSAVRASSLSAGFLLGDIQTAGLCGAENAADREAVGASQDTYARVRPLLAAGKRSRNVVENYYYVDLKQYSLSRSKRVETAERTRSCVKFLRTFSSQQSTWSLYCGQFLFTRAYSGNGTRSEPLYRTKTGYYEILEVSPTSTQAQIKTAYYKQSFIYHPDRNAGSDEATVRFSEISEAYTVLGNKSLRKKYDRGLLTASDLTGSARPSAKGSGKPQTESKRSVVGRDSQGGVFDFDQFFKSYYSEQLQRQRDIRVRKEEMLKKQQEKIGDKKLGRMTEVGVGVLMVAAICIILSIRQ